ncbi:MAG: virulence factor [Chloroflexi bacterium]|nr:virulence factor [Chloroflexota bacterium]
MAKVRVMYWKEIPVQIQAKDESGVVSKPLEERFQQGLDAISMFDGSSGTDDYLMAWEWKDFGEFDSSAQEAATAVVRRFNSGFPADFVARIRDLHNAGQRDTSPGAADRWIEE